jgi:hypothetical protein
MRVFVNDIPFELFTGMKVRHALIAAGQWDEMTEIGRVHDEWGNLLGLDGALCEEMKIYVK